MIGKLAVTLGVLTIFLVVACSKGAPENAVQRPEILPLTNVAQTALKGRYESWNARPGIVIFDFDRDGDTDFFVSNGYGFANWLYRNDGDGTFQDVGEAAGLAARDSNNTGAVACDINNDGYQDLYVGSQGSLVDGLDYRSPIESNQNEDRLFLNNGDGTFTDITESAFGGEVNRRSAMSVACADVDGDGWLDIYVGNLAEDEFRGMHVPYQAGHFNVLYRNNGDLTFTDVTATAGVQGPQIFMRDPQGQPILYQDPATGEMYEGYDPSVFVDDLGNQVGEPTGQTQAVLFFDYDEDGDPDLWVANDGDRLHVFRNDSSPGAVRFTPVATAMEIDKVGAWMGFAVGDYDGDADLDIFVTNVGYHPRLDAPPESPRPFCAYHDQFPWGTCLHFLLRNDGVSETEELGKVGIFKNVAPSVVVEPSPLLPPDSLDPSRIHPSQKVPTGLSAYDFGFGATFFDFDNDGDEDLYWLGSTIDRGEAPGGEVFPSAGRMLRNVGGGAFQDITVRAQLLDIERVIYDRIDPSDPERNSLIHRAGTKYHENGKGVVHGDLNGDGYLDLIGSNSKGALWEDPRMGSYIETGGPLFVWMNPGGENHWITLRLKGRMAIDGTGTNADGIGARVYLRASVDKNGESTTQVQEVRAGSSYLSMDSIELEFGVGQANIVDELRVLWPSGRVQVIENLAVDRVHLIVEPPPPAR